MALEDLIVQSGRQMGQAGQGFFEGQRAAQDRRINQLKMRGMEQEIESYPAKQAAQRAKSAREIEAHELNKRRADQIYDDAVKAGKEKQIERTSKVFGETFIAGDRALKSGETRHQVARGALEANFDRLMEEGDDEDDRNLKQLLAIKSPQKFMQIYNAMKDLNPLIQKRLSKEGESYGFGNVTLTDGTILIARKGKKAGEVEIKREGQWVTAPEGAKFASTSQTMKNPRSPTRKEIDQTKTFINQYWPEGKTKLEGDHLANFSLAVAGRAKKIQADEKVEWEEALDHALSEKMEGIKFGRDVGLIGSSKGGDYTWFDEPSEYNKRGAPEVIDYNDLPK